MVRLILGLFLTAFACAPALSADPKSPPAPYRPLPAGTVLDYGTWKCTVQKGAEFEHVCRGAGGAVARFYTKLIGVGRVPAGGYGAITDEAYCAAATDTWGDSIDSITLSSSARAALRGLWPLSSGKEAVFDRTLVPLNGEHKTKLRVLETRTVSIAGAARGIYVIEAETGDIPCIHKFGNYRGDSLRFVETWWYAPDIASVVHYEIEWQGGPDFGQNISYDLKSITRPSGVQVARTRQAMPSAQPAPVNSPPAAKPRPAAPAPVAVDTSPPEIEVARRLTAEGAIIRLSGRVRDRSLIAELAIDGRPIAVAPDGAFSVRRAVAVGESVLRLSALDEWGNRSVREITVVRAAPPRPPVAAAKPAGNPFADVHFGRYHALVIGNNEYRELRDLATAVPDAREVGRVLKEEYGFDVAVMTNATRVQVIDALAHLRARLTANDNLLIYYAGHGVVDGVTSQGYWLPVDAHTDSPANWVSTADITTMLRAMRARHVMVVADSCYSGTLVRAAAVRLKTAIERSAWVRRIINKRARTALVSGGLEPVMDSGGRGHSVFARAFLNALAENRGVLDGQALFDAIKRPVVLNSNQTPQYSDIRLSGHEGGDFVFVRR